MLCLGPFYHLPVRGDRERAAAELARVLRPGGRAVVALMPRYVFIRRSLALADERHHLAQPAFVARVLEDGAFFNDVPGRFTAAYGARPAEIAPFFERHGFATRALLAAEGIATGLGGALAELATADPSAYAATLDVIIQTAGDPSILGMSNHLLYIGHKLT